MSAVGDHYHQCIVRGCACGGVDGVRPLAGPRTAGSQKSYTGIRLDAEVMARIARRQRILQFALPPTVGAALFALALLGAMAIARWLTP